MKEGSQGLSLGDTILALNKRTLTLSTTTTNMLGFVSKKPVTEFSPSHHGVRLLNFILDFQVKQNIEEPGNTSMFL